MYAAKSSLFTFTQNWKTAPPISRLWPKVYYIRSDKNYHREWMGKVKGRFSSGSSLVLVRFHVRIQTEADYFSHGGRRYINCVKKVKQHCYLVLCGCHRYTDLSCVVIKFFQPLLVSIVDSISACHAEDRGSIPRRGGKFIVFFSSRCCVLL